jgi:hypothetical protein
VEDEARGAERGVLCEAVLLMGTTGLQAKCGCPRADRPGIHRSLTGSTVTMRATPANTREFVGDRGSCCERMLRERHGANARKLTL